MSIYAIRAEALAEAEAAVAAGVTMPPPPVSAGRVFVRGVLTREDSRFSRALGATTYAALKQSINAALAAGAPSLTLDFDSPGGDVHGCHAVASLIASAGIPTLAEVRGVCCSAAYWIAAACDAIMVAPDAALGSIGTMVAVPSQAMREAVTVATGSPRKEATSEDPQWQELADDYANIMLGDIAAWRGLANAQAVTASYGGGAVVSGVRAVALGLADGFLTADEEEGTMPKSISAPAAARAEAPPAKTPEEYEATIAELMARIAELEGKLSESEAKAEAEELPEEAKAVALSHGGVAQALSSLTRRVGEMEAAHIAATAQAKAATKAHAIGVAVAEGRIEPAERPIAEALYDSHPELYRQTFGARAAGSAVSTGRVTHGAAEGSHETLHARAVAHCRSVGQDPNTITHYRAALAAVARKEA